jgi:predicted acyltransferase
MSIAFSKRISSLDQFRGFAILGMILVNYLGRFDVMPRTFTHPRFGMTFANAIAPFFLFAVGMGFRLSLGKRVAELGKKAAYLQAIKRYLILVVIGIVVYGPDPVCDMWDALVDIGFAGLLALPFILGSVRTRILAAIGFLCSYQLLFMFTEYGVWTMKNSIDGGPLGPLSWTAMLLFGTVLMDLLAKYSGKDFLVRVAMWGVPLLLVGFGFTYLEPGEIWDFSQRSMTVAYPLFASGLSFLTFGLFYFLADVRNIKLPTLTILGANPLVIYIVQQVLNDMHGGFLPRDSSPMQALFGFFIAYGVCYIVARYLSKNKYYIKI